MRDWFEQHLQTFLRDRAAAVPARTFSVKEIRQRARWLALRYLVAALVLAGCLLALVLAE